MLKDKTLDYIHTFYDCEQLLIESHYNICLAHCNMCVLNAKFICVFYCIRNRIICSLEGKQCFYSSVESAFTT